MAPPSPGDRLWSAKECPQPAEKERPYLPQSFKNVPNDHADVLATTAKTRQSEQGALKQGGIDLLVMPPKLKGRLPLWRVCSVEPLRGLVKPRNH